MSISVLDSFKALVDDTFRGAPLSLRQNKAADILSVAHRHPPRKEFQELEGYVFENLEK